MGGGGIIVGAVGEVVEGCGKRKRQDKKARERKREQKQTNNWLLKEGG